MIEIRNGKHFNAILVSLKTGGDILRNFDQLWGCKYGKKHMLINSIRLKAPELSEAVAKYCAAVGAEVPKATFAEWAVAENLIPVELVEAAKYGKNILPYSKVRQLKMGVPNTGKATLPLCPYCDKKTNDLATHSCHKTSGKAKKRKSVWAISGGGANGIRNKR